MQSELYKEYKERVVPALRERLGYKNVLQVPRVEKVVINSCVSTHSADAKQALEEAKAEIALISGQRPAETKSKKSISNFKLRKGQAIGAKVTLRGDRMLQQLFRERDLISVGDESVVESKIEIITLHLRRDAGGRLAHRFS